MNTSHYLDQKEYRKFLFENEIKQKATQEAEKLLSQPEILKLVQQLVANRPDLKALAQGKDQNGNPVANAQQKMEQEIKKIEQQVKDELQKNTKSPSRQQVNNSFEQDYSDLEVVDEDIFNRTASRFRAGKEAILGGKLGQQPRNPKETAFLDRYETFKKQMGKHLKELQLDLGKASDIDQTVKNNVSTMANTLSQTFNINPSTSKFQELRHKVTSGGLKLGIGTAVLTPIVALTAPFAASLGLGATAAGAVSGGLSTGIASMVKDLIYGQKPDIKKAAIATAFGVVGGAMAGNHLGAAHQAHAPANNDMSGMADISNYTGGFQAPHLPDYQSVEPLLNAAAQVKATAADNYTNKLADSLHKMVQHWPKYTGTAFGHLTSQGDPDITSKLDMDAFHQIKDWLVDRHQTWTNSKEQINALNKITDALVSKRSR